MEEETARQRCSPGTVHSITGSEGERGVRPPSTRASGVFTARFPQPRAQGPGEAAGACQPGRVEAVTLRLRSQQGPELFPEPHRFSIKRPEKCDNASLPASQSILRC